MQHFLVFMKWNIDEIIQTFIPSDLNISINIHCCPKQYIKTVHLLKISKTTWTKSYFLISPYIIPQLCKWRYMSSIWVRTKSYLRGDNGEQSEVTWPEVTSPEVMWPEEIMSGTGSMICACAIGRFAIPLVDFLPEVKSVTGSDRVRMRNRYILYYN